MRSNLTGTVRDTLVQAWLRIRIHFDAVRGSPRGYLIATWWRLRGKRLRARARFAPLLGRSKSAYRLWVLREETGFVGSPEDNTPPIMALVDVGKGQTGLDDTLSSLAREGVPAVLAGDQDVLALAAPAGGVEGNDFLWLMPVSPGDVLAPGAAHAYHAAVACTQSSVVYADDDLLDADGRRSVPHFKPDWNGELFHHLDYLSGACIVRVPCETLDWDQVFSGSVSRLVADAAGRGAPFHIRRVLHHRRTRPQPRLPLSMLAPARELPPVTIIVPTRNRMDLLRTCLQGIAATAYPDVEVIVVDNDSDDPETLAFLATLDPVRFRVLRHAGPFNFGAINNRAADAARGRMLCLLNNDIEIVAPDWLATMVIQALREDVGAVGARLLYPDGRIQHAGVVLGIGGGAAHAHRLLRPDDDGYHRRHALPQFVSAVTAACLVVARDRFMAVGGFDAHDLPVAFNDVDLCMRLNRRGWQALYEPRATLIHHESISRGFDRDPVGADRLAGELAVLKARWGTDALVDRFHHPNLSPFSERFVTRV